MSDDLKRLTEIEKELALLPIATGENRHIGGRKCQLYTLRRTILQRIARSRGTHTKAEWLAIMGRQNRCCARCGHAARLTKDHIQPISKGGSDAASNLQGLCGPCNSKKGARLA